MRRSVFDGVFCPGAAKLFWCGVSTLAEPSSVDVPIRFRVIRAHGDFGEEAGWCPSIHHAPCIMLVYAFRDVRLMLLV